MSEYPSIRTKSTFDDLDHTGTLFDPALNETSPPDAFDRIDVTGQFTAEEIRQRTGFEKEGSVSPEAPSIAIDVDDRATAIAAIMAYFNKANQVHGSATHAQHGGQALKSRYGDADRYVQQGAEVNRDKLRTGFFEGIDTLAAIKQLRSNGVSEEDIEEARQGMRQSLTHEYGVSNARADHRSKITKRTQRTADILKGRKKPR